MILKDILYIYYLFHFWKSSDNTQTLINSSSKLNIISLTYILKFNFQVIKTNIKAQKIDKSSIITY